MSIPTESLLRRYLWKFLSNAFGFALSLINQAIIPRFLGPAGLGSFQFLIQFFTQIAQFLDFGATTAASVKMAKSPQDFSIPLFYFIWTSLIMSLLVIFTGALFAFNLDQVVFPEQSPKWILACLGLLILMWFGQSLGLMLDALGLTIKAERFRMFHRLLSTTSLLALFFTGNLSVSCYFIWSGCLQILLNLYWFRILLAHYPSKLLAPQFQKNAHEFLTYCKPLILVNLVSLIPTIADRWLLQKFGGSFEQGLFSLASQIAVLCFLFTSAMVPIIQREFSVFQARQDLDAQRDLFNRYFPALFSVAAFLGCFVVFHARPVALLFGGDDFVNASQATAIMALYPIHQTYGQLTSTLLIAAEKTKTIWRISLFSNLINLPCAWFVLAPEHLYGLNGGSIGLAWKMIVLQFVMVNVQLLTNCRILKLPFWPQLWIQLRILGFFLLAGSVAHATNCSLAMDFAIYLALTLLIFYWKPVWIGISFPDQQKILDLIKGKKPQ